MFDGTEKVFNRASDCKANDGYETWEEIENSKTGMHTAKLHIDKNAVESEGVFTDYSNLSIEYGNSVYTFDSNGYLLKISCGDTNIKITFSNGDITTITDGNNNKYSLVYGRFQSGNNNFTYLKKVSISDKNNNPIKLDGQNNYVTESTYYVDDNNHITYKTTYPTGETLEVKYDNGFNIISTKHDDIITTFEYKEGQNYILGYTQTDDNEQELSKIIIDSSNTFERSYKYVSEDNKSEILDFNKCGQLISSIDKNGVQICFDYDCYGNLNSYALEESTPNLINDGEFDNSNNWSEINDPIKN